VIIDAYTLRGRKRSEEHLPNLLSNITAIVDGQSQADPQFRTNRLYYKGPICNNWLILRESVQPSMQASA